MSFFRSQTMVFCEILMPRESAWNIMNRVGQLDMIHIVKSSSSYQSKFTSNLKRCDETLTRIQHIKLFLSEFDNRKLTHYSDKNQMFVDFAHSIQQSGIPGFAYMSKVEDQIIKTQKFFDQQKHEFDKIKQRKNLLVQSAALSLSLHDVIKAKQPFEQSFRVSHSFNYDGRSSELRYKMGLIQRKDKQILQKIVFRISKGNAWIQTFQIKFDEINNVFSDPNQYSFCRSKIVFLIIFQSGEHQVIENKINKTLGSLDCFVQDNNNDNLQIQQIIEHLKKQEKQMNSIIKITKGNIKQFIDKLYKHNKFSEINHLIQLQMYTIKEKILYESLTQCDQINNFLSFKCFIPKSKLSDLEMLKESRRDIPSFMITIKQPEVMSPSRFLTCEMIQIPQQIVNTYGVPIYQQFNPAPLYITTFGMFIGVMFGDIGHMLLTVILLLLIKPNKWWWTVVLWMGYCGMIYNQFFGINLGLFNSCYRVRHGYQDADISHSNCVYAFGIDPIWKISVNQMAFTNSFKMKLSVIIGVLHMTLGIILKGVNSIRKKNYLDLFTLVIPQLLFMGSTFVYMDVLIIIKWVTKYKDTSTAPSIINTLIGMFISNTHKSQFFLGQAALQQFLMILAVLLIPFLLFAKPFVIWVSGVKNKQKSNQPYQQNNQHKTLQQQMQQQVKFQSNRDIQNQQQLIKIDSDSNHHDFKQLMIHQLIETIQFVLGAVSNTASYLRLWALSLAHSQLSQVFFDLLLKDSLKNGYSSIFQITIVFIFFIGVTFGVLVCMDVMECFLHSLRLHWVQFQNKFFSGTGYLFTPYSFKSQITKYQNK